MKISNIIKKVTVSAQITLNGKESLSLYSIDGFKSVEQAFFIGLRNSLGKCKPADSHLQFATAEASLAAKKFGKTLGQYGFHDSEPREIIDGIIEKLLLADA